MVSARVSLSVSYHGQSITLPPDRATYRGAKLKVAPALRYDAAM
jgi:hypothetical protein